MTLPYVRSLFWGGNRPVLACEIAPTSCAKSTTRSGLLPTRHDKPQARVRSLAEAETARLDEQQRAWRQLVLRCLRRATLPTAQPTAQPTKDQARYDGERNAAGNQQRAGHQELEQSRLLDAIGLPKPPDAKGRGNRAEDHGRRQAEHAARAGSAEDGAAASRPARRGAPFRRSTFHLVRWTVPSHGRHRQVRAGRRASTCRRRSSAQAPPANP